MWEKELAEMRVRIKAMRQKLVDGLKVAGVKPVSYTHLDVYKRQ